MTDKEIDKLFRSKLHNQSFEFNPQNWEAMEAMLDARKPQVGAFWRQSAAIMGFGLALGLSLIFLRPAGISPANPAYDSGYPEEITYSLPEIKVIPNRHIEENNRNLKTEELSSGGRTSGQEAKTPKETGMAIANAGEKGLAPEEQAPAKAPVRPEFAILETASRGFKSFSFNLTERDLISKPAEELPPYSPSRFEPEALPKFDNRHEILLEGGPALNSSYSASPGTGWNLGGLYRYRLKRNVSLTGGAQYNRTGNSGITTSSDSVFFGFGRTEVQTEKQYQQISSLRFPLEVEWNLNPAHSLSGGVYADFITAVQIREEKTITRTKAEPRTETDRSTRNAPEFNTFNAGLRAGYTYRLNPRFSLGIKFNYGLTDITRNTETGLEDRHRLLQTDFVIRYRLF